MFKVENNFIDTCIGTIWIIHGLVVMGVDDFRRSSWNDGPNILLVAIAQGTDNPLYILHPSRRQGAVNRRHPASNLLQNPFAQHGIWLLVLVVVVEELVIVICIGQLKWHSIEEHIELVYGEETVVQFHIGISLNCIDLFGSFFQPVWIIWIDAVDGRRNRLPTVQIFWFNRFWFAQFRYHLHIFDKVIQAAFQEFDGAFIADVAIHIKGFLGLAEQKLIAWQRIGIDTWCFQNFAQMNLGS